MTATTTLGTPIQGVTLYSFTRFFHARKMNFDELVREVARRELGPGLEIVGFQSIRDFPNVSAEFVRSFHALIDETGLVPTSMGANADAGLRRDRMLTNDELVEYMAAQIDVARRLGFPIVRVQYSLTPDDMERLVPIAERAGVQLGLEIHSSHTVSHPVIQALLERYEKLGSDRLGFIPDWGATMHSIPPTLLERYRRLGVSEEVLTALQAYSKELTRKGPPMHDEEQSKRMGEVIGLARSLGEERRAMDMAVNVVGLFGRGDPKEWADIMPWVVHTHGKFYEIDASGAEPAVPIPEIIDVYVRNGYSKTISSEWEGFHWNDWESAFDVISRQQALLRRSADSSGSRMVVDASEARTLMESAL
ncbi:MAG TPA: TIM barrel protein [Microbacterium sp.]|uniref:sugar phosphate isomerase/epimerase family protein n=1 Tax=Microbacterium sp. TaxID=51671 RepID=UPI002C4DB526|nr:TIM barrel protein [Microbacterium sp.]HWI30753.1 TIM barrel protein [Microbacterium sp.]